MRITKMVVALGMGAASLIGASTEASALTGWQNFAYVRDQNFPSIGFLAGTARNPEIVRIVVNDGSYTGTTSLSAAIDCYNDALTLTWHRAVSNTYSLPRIYVWDVPTSATYCRVTFEASNSSRYGVMSATAQARYE